MPDTAAKSEVPHILYEKALKKATQFKMLIKLIYVMLQTS